MFDLKGDGLSDKPTVTLNMAKTKQLAKNQADSKMNSMSKSRAGQVVFVRILLIILTDIIVGNLFNFVRATGEREYVFYMKVLPVLRIVFAVLLAAAVCYLIITKVKKIDTSANWITPGMLTAGALYLTVTAFFYNQFRMTPVLFFTLTVVASVLFAVYYIYTILLYKK